jgi:hypothetical protein
MIGAAVGSAGYQLAGIEGARGLEIDTRHPATLARGLGDREGGRAIRLPR